MPVFLGRNPFDGNEPTSTPPTVRLRTLQARVLRVLLPTDPTDPPIDWPVVTRAYLGARAGFTPASGSITRALNGVRAGSSTYKGKNDAEPGLLALGLVVEIVLDIYGTVETDYQITPAGIKAYNDHIAAHGELKPLRSVEVSTNHRYKKKDEDKEEENSN